MTTVEIETILATEELMTLLETAESSGQLRQSESNSLRGYGARQQMAFDLITSASSGREIQLAMKLLW